MDHILDIYIAFLIDALIGDPRWFPHPVRWIGSTIRILEIITVKLFGRNRFSGTITGILTVLISAGFVYGTLYYANFANETTAWIVKIFWLWAGFSCRSLADSAEEVLKPLKSGNISEARKKLSMIVGRNTEELDETDISRATIETVSENSVDGIISPLLYAAIGGAPLLWAFKAISTCDSMVGYKNEKYIKFGTFCAKLDDVANYIPARLSLLIYTFSAWFGGYSASNAFKTARRDAKIHSSPNAGIPEAATAGALEVSLGGPATYGGVKHEKEFFGKEFDAPKTDDISKSINLMWIVTVVMLGMVAGIVFALSKADIAISFQPFGWLCAP